MSRQLLKCMDSSEYKQFCVANQTETIICSFDSHRDEWTIQGEFDNGCIDYGCVKSRSDARQFAIEMLTDGTSDINPYRFTYS